jgi:predicted MFS family arabinose efflux permease
MSLGTFVGASLGGAGLALFGYHGIAAALLIPLVAAIAIAVVIALAASPQRRASGPPMQR